MQDIFVDDCPPIKREYFDSGFAEVVAGHGGATKAKKAGCLVGKARLWNLFYVFEYEIWQAD